MTAPQPLDPRAAVFDRRRLLGIRPRYLGLHLFALLLLVFVWLVYTRFPETYDRVTGEDELIEWTSAILFALAAVMRGRSAWKRRRVFDGLVALFCLFVAGEEISWGQRLLGYTPPSWFLENNTQQETNLHNYADIVGRPKWTLMLVLGAYAALGILARSAVVRRLAERVGATPPSRELVVWLAAAVALLFWYPVSFTGEWVELLAGSVFYAGAVGNMMFALSAVAALLTAQLLSSFTARRSARPEAIACVRAETQALAEDLIGGAALPRLVNARSIDKRVWTAAHSDYLSLPLLTRFHAAPCTLPGTARRREFAVDPWGTAYWLGAEELSDSVLALTVYSFGPNRRAQDEGTNDAADDIAARVILDPRTYTAPR